MKVQWKYALQTMLSAIILFLLLLAFYLPRTVVYEQAGEKFEEVLADSTIQIPGDQEMFRVGFVYGYLINVESGLFLGLFLVSILISVIVVFIYHTVFRKKARDFLLVDPLDSLKNILSNMILFSFGVFNRRAAEPLRYYFNLPVKSRIIGLLAYALIFFSISLLYDFPEGHYFVSQFRVLVIIWPVYPILLITLTFFVRGFRKNFQKRLLWLSIGGLMVYWLVSGYIGAQIGYSSQDAMQADMSYFPFVNVKDLLTNLLIVLAFSFYIELMKSAVAEKSRMEAEIRVAQRIQNELIPEIRLETDSWALIGETRPAKEVGGDYIDAVHMEDSNMAVTVADVSGHNVASGLLMSMLKTAFRTELNYFRDPATLTASLNRTIYDNKDKSMFISFMFGFISKNDQTFSLINGGHPPLLHVSANNGKISEYRTGDLALGLKKEATFQAKIIPFNSGDIFVLYSDGLMESTNAAGGEWGLERMKASLLEVKDAPVDTIYTSLIEAADRFRGSMPQRDDVTLLVLKMR